MIDFELKSNKHAVEKWRVVKVKHLFTDVLFFSIIDKNMLENKMFLSLVNL